MSTTNAGGSSRPGNEPGKSLRRYRVALVGVFLYLILDIIAQLLPPHYSPITQAESDLAVGPFGYVMTLNFLNRGLLSLEFMFALLGTARLAGGHASKRLRGGLVLFGVWSVGALLLAAFPTDVPATPVSWHGAVHLIVAIFAFLGGGFGALIISARMSGIGRLDGARKVALPLAVLCTILCIFELAAPFSTPRLVLHYGGLLERLFLGSVLVWVAYVSAYMSRGVPVDTTPNSPSAT